MHLSPVTISFTVFFIFARLVAASSSQVSSPNRGSVDLQQTPHAHGTDFPPHHHHHKPGHRLHHYTSKEKRGHTWSGAASNAANRKHAQEQRLLSQLHQLQQRPSTGSYRSAESSAMKSFSRRATPAHHSAPPKSSSKKSGRTINVNFSTLANAKNQIQAIDANVGAAQRETQALVASLMGSMTGSARAAIQRVSQDMNASFGRLHKDFASLAAAVGSSGTSYSATESRGQSLWGRSTTQHGTPKSSRKTPSRNGYKGKSYRVDVNAITNAADRSRALQTTIDDARRAQKSIGGVPGSHQAQKLEGQYRNPESKLPLFGRST